MSVLRIEFEVTDYARWKDIFDADHADRAGSGVKAYSILQAQDDPNFVVLDLKFESPELAEAFNQKIAGVISNKGQGVVLNSRRRIFSKAEYKELAPKGTSQAGRA